MKVLFINSGFGKGSTGRIIEELGKELENNGHEYKVAYGRGNKINDTHACFVGCKLEVVIHAGLSRLTDRTAFYSHSATRKLISFIKEYNPDIIHMHNLHGYYINVTALFDYLRNEFKGGIIWTLHDCWSFTGHCTNFSYNSCNKWKSNCFSCALKNEYPRSLIDGSKRNYIKKKEVFSCVPNLKIITVSKWLESVVKESFLSCYPVKTIYNGVDESVFSYVQSNFKEELNIKGKMILLISDGWINTKGFNLVLEIARKSPGEWKFVMVGLDKKQMKFLPQNIIGYERIWDKKRLIEMYSSADLFFNPSFAETFGLVTAEAICCHTPAAVFDTTACPELVENGKNGIVIPMNSSVDEIIQCLDVAMSKKYDFSEFSFSNKRFLGEYMSEYYEQVRNNG